MSIKISPVDVIKMQDESLNSIIDNPFSFDEETVLFAFGELSYRKIELSGDSLMKMMDFTIKKGWSDIDSELKNRVLLMGFASFQRFRETKLGMDSQSKVIPQVNVNEVPKLDSSAPVPPVRFVEQSTSNSQNVTAGENNNYGSEKVQALIFEIAKAGEDLHKFYMSIVWQVVSSVAYGVLVSLIMTVGRRSTNLEFVAFLGFALGVSVLVFFIRMIMFLNKGIKRLKDIDHLNHG
jgi:hypothetical protein